MFPATQAIFFSSGEKSVGCKFIPAEISQNALKCDAGELSCQQFPHMMINNEVT